MARKSDSALHHAIGALTLTLLFPSMGRAQSELSGRIVAESGAPISGATITLASVRYTVRSDTLGHFRLSGQPGSTLALALKAEGYRDETASVTLGRGRGSLTRDFVLRRLDSPEPDANPSDRVLRGRITDPDRGAIAYANVQVNGGRIYVSDDSGQFSVPITVAGGFQLVVRRIGFEPVHVKLDAMPDTSLRIQLVPLATALPEQRITGRSAFVRLDLGGFYRRMADTEKGVGRGYFITPEELEIRNPFLVTSAVEHLPNIRLRPSRFPLDRVNSNMGDKSNDPRNRYLRIEDGTGCPMTIYLDRVRISPVLIRGELRDEQINSLITPTSLSGIEVYTRRATVPREIELVEGTCGAVMLWTR
jgi:hypothetical protein